NFSPFGALREETPAEQPVMSEPESSSRKAGSSHDEARDILIGTDIELSQPVYWDPFPDSGSANPHVLIFGESGYGKTYAIQCLVAELAQRNVPSVIFDYGQGFALDSSPPDFRELAAP